MTAIFFIFCCCLALPQLPPLSLETWLFNLVLVQGQTPMCWDNKGCKLLAYHITICILKAFHVNLFTNVRVSREGHFMLSKVCKGYLQELRHRSVDTYLVQI